MPVAAGIVVGHDGGIVGAVAFPGIVIRLVWSTLLVVVDGIGGICAVGCGAGAVISEGRVLEKPLGTVGELCWAPTAFKGEVGLTGLNAGSVTRADWVAGTAEPAELNGLPLFIRGWLFQAEGGEFTGLVVCGAEAIVLFCPHIFAG